MRSIQESLITRIKGPTKLGNQVKAVKCNNCGNIRYPPRTYCNRCQGTDFTEIIFGPKGEITTYTSTRKRKETDTQRFFGSVRLHSENGKDTLGVGGTFEVGSIDDLDIGQKVEMIPHDKYNVFKIVEE